MIVFNLFLIIISFIVSIVLIKYLFKKSHTIVSEETEKSSWQKFWYYLLSFIFIILGMAAIVFYDGLSTKQFDFSIIRIDFLLSVLISPIILRFTTKQDGILSFESCLVAFQNGFFWEAIFQKF